MLSFHEIEEVFFDTSDSLSPEDSVVVAEEGEDLVDGGELGYDVWLKEPQCVMERRESFLRGMGLFESASSSSLGEEEQEIMMARLNRISDFSSGAFLSSWSRRTSCVEENLVCARGESNGKANCMVDDDDLDHQTSDDNLSLGQTSSRHHHPPYGDVHLEGHNRVVMNKQKRKNWWKFLMKKMKGGQFQLSCEDPKANVESPRASRIKVKQKKKRCMELTAVYSGQEIQAHQGLIWTMKFSPDGRYLASGGEDGVVRVWRVGMERNSINTFVDCSLADQLTDTKSNHGKKYSYNASVIIPDEIFHLEELPLQEFYGHNSDILDLAWSNSNYLLSSSKDKTVRLWQLASDECLGVFHHSDFVTCIQFNPADENFFISGSIDGKVRIWGLHEKRVVDWADARDVITAVCFQPNGQGFIVGSIVGTCRFYEASGNNLQLNAEIHLCGKKKSSGNKITGIQFSPGETHRVMVTSEDSKVRILDGVDVIHKFKGRPKSGSQMSASVASTGKHIISVGEDSRVYVWSYDDMRNPLSAKQLKSVRSCEHFFFEGVSIAIPWPGIMEVEEKSLGCESAQKCCLEASQNQRQESFDRDSERFSLANWFSLDNSCRGSVTWPEEKLPLWDVAFPEPDLQPPGRDQDNHHDHALHGHKHHVETSKSCRTLSGTWGLVIVTAGWDGRIRTFHNYGLPIRF